MKKIKIKKIIVLGNGGNCPKCGKAMERRKHRENPEKIFFYTKWDYCKPCGHIQHYEEFKNGQWREIEDKNNFIRSIE